LTDWTIRSGNRHADIPSVLVLWRAAEAIPSATDTEDALMRLVERDPDSLLLAEGGGRTIGSLIVAWDGWRGSFYRLAVHPDWRRRGIGTTLVRTGEDRLRSLGVERLTAIVANDEPLSVAFWK
jgi:ribosomal protein S18 acetylase RimI-like enzyme